MSFPLAERVVEELRRQMPFLHRATASHAGCPLDERMAELEVIAGRLQAMFGDPENWLQQAVKAYVVMSLDFITLQREVEKTGRYKYSTVAEAQQHAYDNPEVFGGYYIQGLLLSEVFWPNHFRINQLFREFLGRVAKPGARMVEVGVGSGYHLHQLVGLAPDCRYLGVDISAIALDFAQRFAFAGTTQPDGVSFVHGNACDGISVPEGGADAVICGEVIEHVEDPAALLAGLRRLLPEGGLAFVTTAIFAASIDHIYMFECADDVRRLFRDGGWAVESELVLPVAPNDDPAMHRRPMNYGAILKRL